MSKDSTPAAASDHRPAPGERIVFRWRKWDGSPHWVHDCVYLGADAWGDWFGQPAGWRSARPGRDFVAEHPNVTLLPPAGDYAYTHNALPHPVRVYIDIAWDARWDDGQPTGIDMDLDVVRRVDARGVWIDDEDEWDEHRVQYGYPLDLVTRLESLAIELERKVTAREAPFDEKTGDAWLGVLAGFDLS